MTTEGQVLLSIDPNVDHPIAGDTVSYTAIDDAVFGGVVEESHQDDAPSLAWRFRVVGHDGLFNHDSDGWRSRIISRPAAVEVADLSGKSHAEIAAEYGQENADWLAEATPAPLDPKSVHVGDTVTVRFKETGDVLTTKAYQPDDITATGEYVYILGWPLHRANGTFGLAVSHFEILAIEPAPEPEWKPGTAGTATLNNLVSGNAALGLRAMRTERDGVLGFALETGITITDDATTWSVSDFVPDEPRPLPTRDELAKAMHDDYLKGGEPRLTVTAREHLADAVLTFLRGESR